MGMNNCVSEWQRFVLFRAVAFIQIPRDMMRTVKPV